MRFPVFLTLVIAICVVLAFYFGWFSLSSHSGGEKTNVEFSVDKQKIREDTAKARTEVKQLSDKAQQEARDLADKIHRATQKERPALQLEANSLEIDRGRSDTIRVIRTGDLTPLQLELTPSPGSNLVPSGGEFKAGDDTTTITIYAPQDANDGSIHIAADANVETLKVTVRSPSAAF
jgi:hypothetical protein